MINKREQDNGDVVNIFNRRGRKLEDYRMTQAGYVYASRASCVSHA